MPPTSTTGVGPLLKTWRNRRARSQLALANDVGVSARHLSFVETGRSKPSVELVLALADHLEVPLRDRDNLLLAAGFAPRFGNDPLGDDDVSVATAELRRLLDAHDPYPGLMLDASWNVLAANRGATALLAAQPASLTTPVANVFRISLHPEGLAGITRNFDAWGLHLLHQLDRICAARNDPAAYALRDEVRSYPNVLELLRRASFGTEEPGRGPVLTCDLDLGGQRLSLFTTLTAVSTPRSVTLDELVIELFFPADADSARALAALG